MSSVVVDGHDVADFIVEVAISRRIKLADCIYVVKTEGLYHNAIMYRLPADNGTSMVVSSLTKR